MYAVSSSYLRSFSLKYMCRTSSNALLCSHVPLISLHNSAAYLRLISFKHVTDFVQSDEFILRVSFEIKASYSIMIILSQRFILPYDC